MLDIHDVKLLLHAVHVVTLLNHSMIIYMKSIITISLLLLKLINKETSDTFLIKNLHS